MKETISVVINKSLSSDDHWGLKFGGGVDFGCPINVRKVVKNSLADQNGLKRKDVVISLNGVPFHNKKLREANEFLKLAEKLDFMVERIIDRNGNDGENENSRSGCFITRRYQIAILAFLGMASIYSMRVNVSVAIVAMTKASNNTEPEFDWSPKMQGLILSSFFYGYMVTQILGGWFGTRFGGKNIFGLGVSVTAFFTVLSPWLVRTNVYLLIIARAIEGFFEGVTYPALHAFWGVWAPPLERSKLATIAFCGGSFGILFVFPLCGIFAHKFGWPSVFYIFGSLGLLWAAIWCFSVGNSPSVDKYISDKEKLYIEASIGSIHHKIKLKKATTPWKKILTSVPVWGIIIAHFAANWGFFTLLTELPTYLNYKFKFGIDNTGALSALPYLLMNCTIPLGGFLADYLRKRSLMTTRNVRRSVNGIAFLFQAVFLVIVAHTNSLIVTIASLTMTLGFGGLSLSAFAVNPLDISNQFAGVVFGIASTIGTVPGIISPPLTGFLIESETLSTDGGWTAVFYITVALYLIGAVCYWFMASGEPQPWAKPKTTEHQKMDTLLKNVS